MKLPTMILAVSALLAVSACDDKPEKAKRPDLQTPASKDEAKAPGGAKAPGEAKAIGGTKDGAAAKAGRVFFVKPAEGAKVPEQFEVEFGDEGKAVRPAGATERDPAYGHHHVLINTGPLDDMVIVPKDETHLHYGDGATKATLKLPPGRHQLTMQFADGAHRSYGPGWAATITVEVEAGGGEAKAGEAGAAGGAGEAKAGG